MASRTKESDGNIYNNFWVSLLLLINAIIMETVIKVNPSELNSSLLEKIKEFIGTNDNVDVTISLREFDPDYAEALDRSIEQAESGNVVSMTMEDLDVYVPKNKP